MPKRAKSNPAVLHPIQVVTRRTGISADVLRVWEKRYAVVTPRRSSNGRRLYTDADIERLRLLVAVTRTGRTIGQVAALDNAALVARLAEEQRPAPTPHGNRAESALPAPPGAADLLEACIAAIARFDAVALDLLLRRAIVALSANDFLDAVVVPLVEHLRQRTLDGSLRRAHRNLAHAVLRRVLDHVVATATAPLASRDLVVATLAGHAPEVDALVVAAVAAADGWRVTYVGPGVPPDDIVELLEHVGARVLAVSVAAATGDRVTSRELRRLRTLVPAPVELLVAPLAGLAMLRTRLRELRDAASTRALPAERASG
jgi:DNA-binding transcriptional MerR regulator/methylmalonyl-CoA mutase cobalamin-binding subunit